MNYLLKRRASGTPRDSLLFALSLVLATLLQLGSASAIAQQGPSVALISRSVPVPQADQPYVNRLRNLGWNVVLVDDDEVRSFGKGAVSGYDLVVISSTVFPSKIAWRLRSAPEPIIVAEHRLYPSFHFTGDSGSQFGLTRSLNSVGIVDSSSPLAGGFNGTIFVSSTAKEMNFGVVGSSAEVVATASGANNQAVIFAYDTGDNLASGEKAKGRRVGFNMSQAMPRLANTNGWGLFDAAVAWASSQSPTTTQPNTPNTPSGGPTIGGTSAPAQGALLGANVSRGDNSSRYEAVVAFENRIGRDLAIINRFHEFSAGLTSTFFWDRQHIADGRTVMISWRATDNPGSNGGQPDPNRARKIAAGNFDNQITSMARKLRDLGAPILLRFNWEMDQDPGDPQYIGTPSEFIAAWRHTHRIFQQVGANNVEWIWAPRARSFAKSVGPTFYPGDNFVDWIGGSAVPINSFTDAQTIYSAWNQWASNKGKPQLLWVGLRENPADARWKENFIDELNQLTSGPWNGVKALVYYHSFSPKGLEYWIDTSFRSLSAFRDLSCSQHYTMNLGC